MKKIRFAYGKNRGMHVRACRMCMGFCAFFPKRFSPISEKRRRRTAVCGRLGVFGRGAPLGLSGFCFCPAARENPFEKLVRRNFRFGRMGRARTGKAEAVIEK